MVERIVVTPASTPEGIRAKAEVLAPVEALDVPMVASLVSDIIGQKVGDLTGEGRRRYMRNHYPRKEARAART